MPFPSGGCQTCKNRRIKCDETQPICRRCAKSDRICYGTRSRHAMSVIHSENTYASGETRRPRGPRSSPTHETAAARLEAIYRNLTLDLETQAVAYYVHEHLQSSAEMPSMLKAFPHDIISIRESKRDLPVLELALSSLALATFARNRRHPLAAVQASRKYQKVLQDTCEMLNTLDERGIDVCLLSIYSMSRYEDTIHINKAPTMLPNKTFASFSHHDGTLAILELWKSRFGHKSPASDVIKHARRGVIRSAVMRHLPMPEWLCDGRAFGEHGMDLKFDVITVRIIRLRRHTRVLSENDAALRSTLDSVPFAVRTLAEEASQVDRALQDWTVHLSNISQDIRPLSLINTDTPAIHGHINIRQNHSAPVYAAIWNHYYAMRMLLCTTQLRILKLGHAHTTDYTESWLSCQEQLKRVAQNLASTVVLCLGKSSSTTDPPPPSREQTSPFSALSGDINPYLASLVVWPLTIAASLAEVDTAQKQWFRSQLASLGRIMGIGVLACAESEQWLEI